MNKKNMIISLALLFFCAFGINAMEPPPKRRKIDPPEGAPLSRADEHFLRGQNYYTGVNVVRQDKEIAADYFILAAEAGHAEAQYKVAGMYHAGDGLKQNTELSNKYLSAAASNGHAEANYDTGLFYLLQYMNQNEPAKNHSEYLAFNHLFVAAQEGNVYARYIIGRTLVLSYMAARAKVFLDAIDFEKGGKEILFLGHEKEFLEISRFERRMSFEVFKFYSKAVNIIKNSPRVLVSAEEILELFTWRCLSFEDDDFENLLQWGLEFLRNVAAQGHLEATYFIAKIADTKQLTGMTLNDDAELYLKSAAERGYAPAQLPWAHKLFDKGDDVNAETWLQKAAEGGSAQAQFEWACRLFRRLDGVNAETWLQKAADGGYDDAQLERARRLAKQRDYVNAVAWLQKVLIQNNSNRQAKSLMAGYLLKGKGVQQNYAAAFKYLIELNDCLELKQRLSITIEEEEGPSS